MHVHTQREGVESEERDHMHAARTVKHIVFIHLCTPTAYILTYIHIYTNHHNTYANSNINTHTHTHTHRHPVAWLKEFPRTSGGGIVGAGGKRD